MEDAYSWRNLINEQYNNLIVEAYVKQRNGA